MTEETGEAMDARAAVVGRALLELGEQNPNKYYTVVSPEFLGHIHDKAWCGIFALWCLVEEKLCDWKWGGGLGFVYKLPWTRHPQPGDIAVFTRGASGKVVWHHAIVKYVEGNKVHTIDGNSMPYPKEGVTEEVHPIDSNVNFYSIEPLVSEEKDASPG